MENPATWGPLEHAIAAALKRAEDNRAAGLVGLSQVRIVADAVREVIRPIELAAGFALSEARRAQGKSPLVRP